MQLCPVQTWPALLGTCITVPSTNLPQGDSLGLSKGRKGVSKTPYPFSSACGELVDSKCTPHTEKLVGYRQTLWNKQSIDPPWILHSVGSEAIHLHIVHPSQVDCHERDLLIDAPVSGLELTGSDSWTWPLLLCSDNTSLSCCLSELGHAGHTVYSRHNGKENCQHLQIIDI